MAVMQQCGVSSGLGRVCRLSCLRRPQKNKHFPWPLDAVGALHAAGHAPSQLLPSPVLRLPLHRLVQGMQIAAATRPPAAA